MNYAKAPRQVTSTPRVFFDEDFKTFRLYAGTSMYAFCITPELALEHLYWGEALPPGYDLRYLSQSSRNAHFNTVEGSATDQFGGRIVLEAETLEEVMKTYKDSKKKSSNALDKSSSFQKRRLENYSWRILNKATQENVNFRERRGSFELQDAESRSRASSSASNLSRMGGAGGTGAVAAATAATATAVAETAASDVGDDWFKPSAPYEVPMGQPLVGADQNTTTSTATSSRGSQQQSQRRLEAHGSFTGQQLGQQLQSLSLSGDAGEEDGGGGNGSNSNMSSAMNSPMQQHMKGRPINDIHNYASSSGGMKGIASSEADTDPEEELQTRRRSRSQPMKFVKKVSSAASMEGMASPGESGAEEEQSRYTMKVHHLQAFKQLMGGTGANVARMEDVRRQPMHSRHFQRSKKQVRRHHQRQTFERTTGKMGKGLLCVEYSDYGTGDFRSPSFLVVDNFNGSNISPLRYRKHAIYRGKLPMPDNMPGIRCLSEREASTLVVTMADIGTGLEVDLVYVAMHDYDAITRRAVFRNVDTRPRRNDASQYLGLPEPGAAAAAAAAAVGKVTTVADNGNTTCISPTSSNASVEGNSKVVQKASSMSIDFEATSTPYHLVKLSGSWGRERYVTESLLQHGHVSFSSSRGVSGHVHNPFAAVTIGPPNETLGEVKAFSFVYSGNYLIETEISEMGRLRCNVGINPMGLQWHLTPNKTFNTPEVVMARSKEGLGGMSRAIHRLFLDRLLPRNWSDAEPPILLNSWEAKYFHVNHSNIVEMAQQASNVGINLIVLDDGWFGKRENDTCSLGDWVADMTKFPHGIKGLAEDVNAAGCKFGLWFEPEMVSEDSMLYTTHPDWYLHVPGRPRQIGRNQMVLDLSRQEVVDYVFNSLAAILSTANVEYVKWDMNRPLTEVYSAASEMGEVWQAEVSHRYMLGVYQIMNRVITTFPHILLENCASGGGRFDPGMLYYSPQIWCSDNTDAITRMRIQYGTSMAYPARSIGAHVSTVPNHITGSTTRLRTRAFVAMCGTFGYELDISSASQKDLLAWRAQIDLYKQLSPTIRWGDLYRLWDPFKVNLASWMYVSRDKSQAVVFAFSMNSDHWSNLVPRLQLLGLQSDAEYEVTEPMPNNITQASGNLMIIETEVPVYQLGVSSAVLTGSMLMAAGLPVKFYTLDDSVMFVLNRVPDGTGGGLMSASTSQNNLMAYGGLGGVNSTSSVGLSLSTSQMNLSNNFSSVPTSLATLGGRNSSNSSNSGSGIGGGSGSGKYMGSNFNSSGLNNSNPSPPTSTKSGAVRNLPKVNSSLQVMLEQGGPSPAAGQIRRSHTGGVSEC